MKVESISNLLVGNTTIWNSISPSGHEIACGHEVASALDYRLYVITPRGYI